LCGSSCKKEDAVLSQTDTTALKDVAPFEIGASVVVPLLQNNSLYNHTVMQQYSSITTANTLKWYEVHPSINVFDFSGGDYVADFLYC
jgi:GH35 family endo-1,4-beta-xylanase